jgi:hypothetical protein
VVVHRMSARGLRGARTALRAGVQWHP